MVENTEEKTFTFGDWWDGLKEKKIKVKIPDYQRPYSWEQRNVESLLEDLDSNNNFYFLGMFLFEKKRSFIELIDGQQRFTTLVMILHAIGECIKIDDNHILQLQDINNKDFKKIIDNRIDENKLENQSSKKLFNAYESIKNHFANNPNKKKILEKIKGSVVHTYATDDTKKAMYIFELLNDRGKALSSLETIKSSAMYNAKKYDDEDSIKDSFIEINKHFESILKQIPNIHTDDILRYHYIAYFSSEKKDYSGDNTRFNLKKEISDPSRDPKEIIEKIEQTFYFFKEMVEKIHNGNKSWLRCLFMQNRMAQFYPLLIKINDTEKVELICNYLEFYVFQDFVLSNSKANKNVSFFYRLAKKYLENMDMDMDQLKKEILGRIAKIDYKKVETAIDSSQFYWDQQSRLDRTIVLLNYDHSLKTSKENNNEISLEHITKAEGNMCLTAEHIYPQTPKEEEKDFCEYRGIEEEDFRENYLHSLGNLVISRKGANSSKGNNLPEDKEWAGFESQIEIKGMIEEKFGKDNMDLRKENIKKFITSRWFNFTEEQLGSEEIIEIIEKIEDRELLI